MTINKTMRRKGVHEAKIGGGFKPVGIKKITIKAGPKPRPLKMPSYFTKGHVF